MVESIYDELVPLKFSNALLPDFRRKQDVARIRIEAERRTAMIPAGARPGYSP